jgi:hypothetical protein
MRIVATERFLMAARAAGRTVEAKCYIRKTASRSDDLTGAWIDVTDYVSKKDFPSFKNDLEINLSQFSASRITLTGLGIAWWESNIFDYTDFIELKVVYIISGLTGEPVPVFAGWIKKKKEQFDYKRHDRSNTLKFEVWSYIDHADEIHGTSLLRQYVNDDVDGGGTDGLILPHVNNLFVTNANVADYVLKKGIHSVAYQVDGADKQAKLDDGDWVTLSTGSNTLINGDGDQKVIVYCNTSILPASGEYNDDIIVDSLGDTIPKNWYYALSARYLLQKLFDKAGITTVSFDSLEYPTSDGSRKISFKELVADTESITSKKTSVAFDGTYHWFGVDNKLYRRDSAGTYAMVETLTSGYYIRRIFHNSRNGHLWLLVASTTAINFDKVYVYIISSDTLTNGVTITGTSKIHTASLIDYEYASGYYKYCLVFIDIVNTTYNWIDEVSISGSTLSITTIYSGDPNLLKHKFTYVKNFNELYFAEYNGSTGKIRKMHIDNTGAWVDDGHLANGSIALNSDGPGAYNYTDDKIYFAHIANYALYSYTPGSASAATALTFNLVSCDNIISDEGDFVYLTVRFGGAEQANNIISISNEIITELTTKTPNQTLTPKKQIYTHYGGLYWDGSIVWGVDQRGILFKYDTSVSLFVDTADMEGLTVRGAIEKCCASFNLVYRVSSNKTARVQRRSDENGDVVTTGYTIELNSDNIRDISDDSFYGDTYDIIKVSNGLREVRYDGSVYDAVAFGQEKIHSIESDWIPDEILEDLAYNSYQFFSVPHKVFLLPSPAALIQYESLDGATIVHNGKMVLNKMGVIVSDVIEKPPGGRPEFKILVNA